MGWGDGALSCIPLLTLTGNVNIIQLAPAAQPGPVSILCHPHLSVPPETKERGQPWHGDLPGEHKEMLPSINKEVSGS